VTVVKTLAAYEIVQAVHPHPVTERDELGMAVGKAIDGALSRYSHEFTQGKRPTATAMNRFAAEQLDEELAAAALKLPSADREAQLLQVAGVLRAFRGSELMGMPRPKSRLVLVNEQVGFYAQPDYWNGKDRFYEMKSYRVPPVPPAIGLQIQLFQLAFPGFRAILASFDRHANPVPTILTTMPTLERSESERVLRVALQQGLEVGKDKVLEYVDSPVVRYSVPAA
jgi:hypothetical protein